MTRDKDDDEVLYNLLGTKEYKKELIGNLKMKTRISKLQLWWIWLTGFDVPCLDTMYIDKAVQQHNLLSRRFPELTGNTRIKIRD